MTFVTAPATGTTVDLRSLIPETQPTNFANLGAYLPESTTNAVDRVTRNIADLYRLTYLFGIHGPDIESAPWPSVGTAAARANTYLGFGSSGQLQVSQAIPSGTLSSSAIGQFIYPPLPGEVNVVNIWKPYGWLQRYGAVLDGVTDDTLAMVSAAAFGGLITQNGPMALASASLAALPNQSIVLKKGTIIQGYVGFPITVTGTTPCNVFSSTNISDVEFIDVFVKGNGVGTVSLGYLWYITCNAAATGEMKNCKWIRGGAENFAGNYWIYADNTASTGQVFSNFTCDGAHFTSKLGNCQYPTNILGTASIFGFSGSNTLTSGYTIKDVVLRNCTADGTFIKNFVFFWTGTLRCKAHSNTLTGFGSDSSISNDTACYALAAYDFSHGTGLKPQEIEFYDNTIDGVRDCGVYAAACNTITIRDNSIQTQTSTANTVIPKGAIAANDCLLMDITDNLIIGCQFGISLAQNADTISVAALNTNKIFQLPNNAFGLALSGSSGGAANEILVNGLIIDLPAASAANVTGIYVNVTSSVGITNLDLNNIDIHGASNGINFFSPDASIPALGNVRINNVKLRRCTTNNLVFPNNCTNANQRITIENLVMSEMQAGAAGLNIASVANVTVRGVTFEDMTSGGTACWYGASSTGRVSGVQYVNCAINNRYSGTANELGVIAPAFTGKDNDFIQDLNPNEQGITSSKYVRLGWTWDRVAGAWKECRSLTGN